MNDAQAFLRASACLGSADGMGHTHAPHPPIDQALRESATACDQQSAKDGKSEIERVKEREREREWGGGAAINHGVIFFSRTPLR